MKLKVASLSQTLVVSETHSAQQLADLPAQITVLSAEDVSRSAALTLDDLLKQVPSFSLFRRSSSLVSQPTTQGVSLRGIGASGVSRTLVLLDGVPFNDPVGSWVYWSRIPRLEIEKIEVDEGGVSSLYGSSAMAGIIEIHTRRPDAPLFDVQGLLGTRATADLDFFAGDRRGPMGYSAGGNLFRTSGYKTVPDPFRGAVDVNATSQHESLDGRANYHASPSALLFLGGAFFNEARGNGTRLQANSTRAASMRAGLRAHADAGNDWQANFFAFGQRFQSSFSAIAANRSAETLSLRQDEPSHGLGGNAQWSRLLPGSQLLSIGADGRWTYARNQESVFSSTGVNTVKRRIPAKQAFLGTFLQDFWTPWRRLSIMVGARVDYWKNYDATQADTMLATSVTKTTFFGDTSNTTITPRGGLVFRATGSLSLRAAFYQGFRAPTLDELYRSFRVGNILTNANPGLGPERVTGYEFGANQQITPRLFWRLTAFADRLNSPVSNITLRVTPDLITRQRENLGYVNIKGVEAEVDYRVLPKWRVQGRYLFDQTRVGSFRANRAIIGNRLPQVPKHRASLLIAYFRPSLFDATVEARFESHRFDDDQNKLKLGRYFVVNLGVTREIGEHWRAFVNVENAFNSEYAVQASPVIQVGTPILITGGVRFRLF
jgi:outer membrane receptor protein involved in Fe transport